MATPDSTLSSLAQIRNKVRYLTRSLTEAQLTTQQIDNYVNTFILYDFPEHLRLFNLLTTFTFFTEPFQDTYTSSDDPTSVFYNFKNVYIDVNKPIYIAGRQSQYLQSREQFFAIWPMTNAIQSIGETGDGSTTTFTGVILNQQAIPFPYVNNGQFGTILLKENVLFSSVDVDGNSLALIDFPISPINGLLGIPGSYPISGPSYGTINYVSGQFSITFPTAPAAGAPINSQTVQVQPAIPETVLYYDGEFVVRPVPDQAYRINMEIAVRPTELLNATDVPNLSEWWQYISYGAAKKVLEDRMDTETIQQILPEYKKQELLCLRRTIVQQSTQRVPTIYQSQTGGSATNSSYGWGSGGISY